MAGIPVSASSASGHLPPAPHHPGAASQHPRLGAHEVFISHRGLEMKQTFASHLYHALTQRGISTFLDSEEIPNGEDAGPFMVEAAKRAIVGVPIFSSIYAQSSWCLEELAQMMNSKRSGNAEVIPVYYDVKPEDLRKKEVGPYAEAMDAHRKSGKYSEERISGWESALRDASWLGSTSLRLENYNNFEGQFIKVIAKEISKKLSSLVSVDKVRLVGIEERVEEVLELLHLKDEEKVHLVLLWGMGGVGKTTLAKAVYKRLKEDFQAASFVEKCGNKDSHQIQCELLKQLLLEENASEFRTEERLHHGLKEKKVLVVLDDVQDCPSIEQVLDSVKTAKPGSRILVTSRDQRAQDYFPEVFSTELYKVQCMDHDQALRLFCLHAFRKTSPNPGFGSRAEEVTRVCHGLPLALQVLGCYLRARKEEQFWKEAIEQSHSVQHEDIAKVLMISYNALRKNEQELFLDVACLLIGEEKRTAEYFWDGDNLVGGWRNGLQILMERCMLEVDVAGRLAMHDHLRDLGRCIVKDEYFKSGKCSRLWAGCPFLNDVLERRQGLDRIRGLAATSSLPSLNAALLSRMRSLQLLFLENTRIVGDLQGLKGLRIKWLRMNDGYSLKSVYHFVEGLEGLRIEEVRKRGLKMVGNPIEELYSDSLTVLESDTAELILFACGKQRKLQKLEMFNACVSLEGLPECLAELAVRRLILPKLPSSFMQLKNLSKLSMEGCINLGELCEDFGSLENLEVLRISGTGIAKLPSSFGQLRKLRNFQARHCKGLKELCEDFGSLESLELLDLESSGIAKLPSSFGQLRKLWVFDASFCEGLKELPEDFGSLESLEVLHVMNTGIAKLPSSFGQLRKLQELWVCDSEGLEELPEDLGSLESLEMLDVDLRGVAELPASLCKLRNLRQLSVRNREGLMELPENLGSLESLQELVIMGEGVAKLPSSLWQLRQLRELRVSVCKGLTEVDFGSLESLEELELRGTGCAKLPSSLGSLKKLRSLDVSECEELKQLPEDLIRSLESLEQLGLCNTGITKLPSSLGPLKKLRRLEVSSCRELKELGEDLIGSLESLEELNLSSTGIAKLPSSLGQLKKLRRLDVSGCEELKELPGHLIKPLESLEELDLSRTGIAKLSSSLMQLKKRRRLDFS